MSLSPGLPELFLRRLSSIVPPVFYDSVCASFSHANPLCIRINTLLADERSVCAQLAAEGWMLTPLFSVARAYVLSNCSEIGFSDNPLVRKGFVYQQAPSSLLPVCVVTPLSGENVLDACAAPGSKTTQMSACMNGEGEIVAVESVKARFYRLRSVCQLLGAKNVRVKLSDARRMRFAQPCFDKILVDAPCSSEGRFHTGDPESYAYWSERKIKEMSYKQKGILLNASRGLKVGGRLVYSTCTFAPEENEEVVDWFLHKTENCFRLCRVDFPGVNNYPALQSWKGRDYSTDLSACYRVLPDRLFGGFFIACFERIG